MSLSLFFPLTLSFLALAAHFLRQMELGLSLIFLSVPFLLFFRRPWNLRINQIFLSIGILEWASTAYLLAEDRVQAGKPWLRLALIFTLVISLALLSILLLERKKIKEQYTKNPQSSTSSLWAFLLTLTILFIVQVRVSKPVMLLFERFFPGMGWFEIFLLCSYAAFITEKILNSKEPQVWRSRIWWLFSMVFFAQLILGLLGAERMLMTGELHLPVPAVIVGGPIFRGDKFFMTILFASTLLIVGPAWCSHLCYVGAWDHGFASQQKFPKKLKANRKWLRLLVLGVFIAGAIILRLTQVSGYVAAQLAGAFGIVGLGIMALFSRKNGQMYHCITWCPIGLLANFLGKISPFRVKFLDQCDNCLKCKKACRYDALNKTDIESRKPGFTCTLCGDCLSSCDKSQLVFSFGGLDQAKAKRLFYILVISLHASFLGLARI
jgi:ferredoxin